MAVFPVVLFPRNKHFQLKVIVLEEVMLTFSMSEERFDAFLIHYSKIMLEFKFKYKPVSCVVRPSLF